MLHVFIGEILANMTQVSDVAPGPLVCYYLPLEKGYPLHLNKPETPFCKDDLWQVWLKLAQWFWRSRNCKGLQTDGQPAIRKARLSFQFRWNKKN
jgi:hypothetical protein